MIREPIRYVVYLRASTGRQGKGGLGMDTQYAAVVEFVRQRGGTIVAQYVELDAGRAGIDQGRRRPGAVNARPSQYLTPTTRSGGGSFIGRPRHRCGSC
jgi:hypothetical protein